MEYPPNRKAFLTAIAVLQAAAEEYRTVDAYYRQRGRVTGVAFTPEEVEEHAEAIIAARDLDNIAELLAEINRRVEARRSPRG